MKIAFDFDGVLTKHPRLVQLAISMSYKLPDNVLILTAAAGELAPECRPAEVRRRADKLGLYRLAIVCVESADKPKWCKENGVDILIDDTPYENLGGAIQFLVK